MAIKVYRYEYTGPTQAQIEPLVTGHPSPTNMIGTPLQCDWTFDDADTDPEDLALALGQYCWTFVSDVTP